MIDSYYINRVKPAGFLVLISKVNICHMSFVCLVAIVTLLENSKDSGEQYVRTVAFLKKGNSFGVSYYLRE